MTVNPTIPYAARGLLDFIGQLEAPKGYDTIYGNNQIHLAKPLTTMTVGQVLAAQTTWTKSFGSSAAGRYQFMKATLQDMVDHGYVSPSSVFTPEVQDGLAMRLLNRRGWTTFSNGRLGIATFGKQLAQEWASLPVLVGGPGAHRTVARGESYYAGDAVNKSLASAAVFEDVLNATLRAARQSPVEGQSVPEATTLPDAPASTAPTGLAGLLQALAALFKAIAAIFKRS